MDSLQKELFLACLRGDVEGVKYYLDGGANMNLISPVGKTALGVAAQTGNVEILQVFLDYCKNTGYKASAIPINMKYLVKEEEQTVKCYPNDKNEQSSAQNCSVDFDPNSGLNKFSKFNMSKDSLLKKRSMKWNILSAFYKTTYDLVTFNDTFLRRDPRFKCRNTMSDVECDSEEESQTPDGMDDLEWDEEVEGNKGNVSKCEDYMPALHFWYALWLKTSSSLEEKPPPNDIDREDKFGCRALHYAALEGHAEAVKLLINAGCKVNVGDSDNLTPLHMAAAKDAPEVMELLIKAGANIHQKTTDRISPLHVSASRGYLESVKLLINAGAHIDTLDSSDRSPLFMAVSRSHQNVVAYLLGQGAKVNLEEIHGYTPLCEAVWQKNTTIVKMLLDAGAKITQSHYLLHYAILHRHKKMVRLLIAAGSIINLRDENGDTPLIVAAKTLQSEITRLLLMNGASINFSSYVTGKSPIHEIISSASVNHHKFHEMFYVLDEFGVDIEAKTDAGCTPLCLAISRKLEKVAATLIRHGADVNHSHSLHPDLFSHVLLRDNRLLTQLFVYAGYGLRDVQLPNKPFTLLEQWISHLKANPMKLCDLCRIKIRSQFKSRIYQQVSKLDLPPSIKTFLQLGDIHE